MTTFETFWNLYPKVRRVNKKGAKTKWDKFTPEVHKQIITHLEKRVVEDEQWIKGFAPMPVTFLNQERWQDEYESVKQPKKEERVYNNKHTDSIKEYNFARDMFLMQKLQDKVSSRKHFINFMFMSLTGKPIPEESKKEVVEITLKFFKDNPKRMYPNPMLYKHLMYGTPVAPQALMAIIATDIQNVR